MSHSVCSEKRLLIAKGKHVQLIQVFLLSEALALKVLQDLIQQIEDPALRDRIAAETNKLLKQKKFGLVFEEHLPECTPLYEVPVRVGGLVAKKTG